jgi:SAM-dependent methyltransferase
MATATRSALPTASSHQCICGREVRPSPFSTHFEVYECESCGTQQFHPRSGVTVPEFRYDGSSSKYAQDSYLRGRELRWSHSRLMRSQWTGRRVLEVGCFNGFFLQELRSLGADVYGFDVNEAALDVGRTLFGLRGRLNSSLDEILALAPFDDIVCIDLVEHLDKPDEFLSRMRAALLPGGRLFVAGPTVERRFFDKSDYPPHHKWRFSRRGLVQCLEGLDFSVEHVDIQYDGLLMLRNAIGKVLNGPWKKEFLGDVTVVAPSMQGNFSRAVYGSLSAAGQWLFKQLGMSYCSTIVLARRR